MSNDSQSPQRRSDLYPFHADWKRLQCNAGIFLFFVVWIFPVLYYGVTDTRPPWLPEFVAQRANVSRLFPKEDRRVTIYEIRYRRHSQPEFSAYDESDGFPMRPFGFRSRMQRALRQASPARREALLEWVRERLNRKAPSDAVAEIRLLRFSIPTGNSSEISGGYVQATSSSADPENVQTLSAHVYP